MGALVESGTIRSLIASPAPEHNLLVSEVGNPLPKGAMDESKSTELMTDA